MVDQYLKSEDGKVEPIFVYAAANRTNLWLEQSDEDMVELDPKQMRELIAVLQNFLAVP